MTTINELSKKTLGSYVRKATTASNRAHDKADKAEDAGCAIDGNKHPEKQKKFMADADKHSSIAVKRDDGITLAKSKLSGGRTEAGHRWGPSKKANIPASKNKKLVKEDVQPLIIAAASGSAVDFTNVFEELITNKIADLVETKKEEIASTLLGSTTTKVPATDK
jgi:hypothetical protein